MSDPEKLITQFHRLVAEGREGFTLDSEGCEYAGLAGYAVGTRRYETVEEAVAGMSPGLFLGWWRSDDGVGHIDLVHIFQSKATALIAAYCRGQAAIYGFAEDDLFFPGDVGVGVLQSHQHG